MDIRLADRIARSSGAAFAIAAAAVVCAAADERVSREDYGKLFRGTVTSADAHGNVTLGYDFASAAQYEDFEGVPRGAAGKLKLSLWKAPVWMKARFEGDVALELEVATEGGPGAIHVLVDPETEEGYVFLFGVDFAPTRSLTAVGKCRKGKPPETLYVGQRGSWKAGKCAISLSRKGDELEMAIDRRIVIKTKDQAYTRGKIGFSGDLTVGTFQVRSRLDMRWCAKALSAAPEAAASDDFFGLVGVGPGFRLARELPEWSPSYEHTSAHWVVVSNASRGTAETWARSAEAMYALFTRIFPPHRKDAAAGRIVIFDSRAEFVRFGGPPKSLGFYLPRSRTVYLFDHLNPAVTRKVLLHECFVQYLRRFVETPPAWLERGMAQYFETAEWDGETFAAGTPGPRLRLLARLMKDGTTCDLPAFLAEDDRAFRNPFEAGRNHACAGGLAHFLMHGRGGAYRSRMVAYVGALMSGVDARAAREEAFGAFEWDRVKSQWFDYIAELAAK